MSASQLQREFCHTCQDVTLHSGLNCIHCGAPRPIIKNQLEWSDDHTPKFWNLKRRHAQTLTYGARLRARSAKRRAIALRKKQQSQTLQK